MRTNDYWLIAIMVFILAIAGDFIHAIWFTAERMPVFIDIVFGNDWIRKLLFAGLFVLLIAGCEVSE